MWVVVAVPFSNLLNIYLFERTDRQGAELARYSTIVLGASGGLRQGWAVKTGGVKTTAVVLFVEVVE